MMNTLKITFRFLLAVVLLIGLMVGTASFAKEEPEEEGGKSLAKAGAYEPERYAVLNINNLWAWQREDGQSNHSPLGDNGVFYPRNTSYIIYQDGIVWGSKAYLDADHSQPAPFDQLVRVGGATYGTGSREGWVEGLGASAVQIEKDHPDARVWRIRRDWLEMSDSDIKQDVADCYEEPLSDVSTDQTTIVMNDYVHCWNNWPEQHGAPYIDRNGNGEYDPPPAFNIIRDSEGKLDVRNPAYFGPEQLITGGYDEPGIAGADPNSPAGQVVFTIWNDLYKGMRFGSEPTGLEVQSTIWGYKRADALGNIFFRKIRFLNKGGIEVDESLNKGAFHLDSMYVCQWSDPDLGSAGDDLLGCDTTLSMGYVYNGNAIDIRYRDFGLAPPSGGYDFLQGPAIPSPGDVAVFDLKYKQDYKNLGMSGFSYFSAGSPYSDPSNEVYDTGALRWWKMFRGYAPLSGEDAWYNHPPGVEPGPYPLAGDPVKGTGHIDGQGEDYSFVPGDRRLLCITGPWQMAPGDTQEIVVAFVAGLGGDRLSSVLVMKFNDRFAQATYDALFAVPSPPPTPNVQVTELDGMVLLEWRSDDNTVKAIEQTINNPGGFVFEGYNVYQLPTAQSTLSDGMRLATYDLPTDPATVLDEGFDPGSGQILTIPVQFGGNSGVNREFIFDRDYVNDIDKINNGTDYFLVVTAYSVATVPGYLPTSLESPMKVLAVIPQGKEMGEVYHTVYGDILSYTQNGTGTSYFYPIVIDPDAVTGETYTVSFNADKTWKISRGGTTVFDGLTNYGAAPDDWPVVGGIRFEMRGVEFSNPLDFYEFNVTPEANAGNYDIDSYFASGWSDNNATAFDAYGAGTEDIVLLQSDIELRFTGEYDAKAGTVIPVKEGTGSLATVYRANTMETHPLNPNPGSGDRFTLRVPFEVWDVERDMQIGFLMRDRIQEATDDPFYAFNPNDRVYGFINGLPYSEEVLTEDTDDMLTWSLVFWTTGWKTGDVVWFVYINPTYPGVDTYTVNSAGYESTVDEALKKGDLERIGVFPNPYYAFNPLEVNKLTRFVTFNNLPDMATIRIFNLAGHLVKVIEKNDETTFARWDLLNQHWFPIASGMYLAYIEIPDVGTKVLKLAIIQEAEVLDVY